MKHSKYDEIKTLVENNINVLISGPAASGKSTTIMQVCDELDYDLKFISCSQQMTVSHLLGFMSVSGTYIRTQFRDAVEHGAVFLLDEIDAASPNTLLVLNALESGKVSFPDTVVPVHENFRLCATANTIDSDNHSAYTGRNTLDEATLSRFDVITFELDTELERSLVDPAVYRIVSHCRDVLASYNDPKVISMRDTIRYDKRASIGLADKYYEKLLGHNGHYITRLEELLNSADDANDAIPDNEKVKTKAMSQSDCNTIDELWSVIQNESVTTESSRSAVLVALQQIISRNRLQPDGWKIEYNHNLQKYTVLIGTAQYDFTEYEVTFEI